MAPRPTAKLSSGILNMKFMQKEDSPQPEIIEDPKPSNKFVHEADPGAWFGPKSDLKSRSAPAKLPESPLGYADLFDASASSGRKSFGPKVPTIDPEQMVKKEKKGAKRKAEKGRLSEGGEKPRPKKRKSV